MKDQIAYLEKKLAQRKNIDAYRSLTTDNDFIDFCSNDYLGLASTPFPPDPESKQYGSKGSRLLSGNYTQTEKTEHFLATHYHAPSALLFNSGYDANLGLFSCIASREDTIIYDELIHASIRDGIRLSNARAYAFKHNDLNSLENKIKNSKGLIYVAIESVYSMDGDYAPIASILDVCKTYGAALIVDEAHATGIEGKHGKGCVVNLALEKDVFARVITFGKAYGAHGAIIAGSSTLRSYLINYARSFIYTTALPLDSVHRIHQSHLFLQNNLHLIDNLQEIIRYFKAKVSSLNTTLIESQSPIQSIIIPGNQQVQKVANYLQKQRLNVKPILSPTVAEGKERLRISLHAFNTKKEIDLLLSSLKKCLHL